MKEASGELNMTVITIIAIGLVAGFFTWIFNNVIQNTVKQQWNNSTNPGFIINNYERCDR